MPRSGGLPGLGSVMIFAVLQMSGMVVVATEMLMREVKYTMPCVPMCLSRSGKILSGPNALEGFSFLMHPLLDRH